MTITRIMTLMLMDDVDTLSCFISCFHLLPQKVSWRPEEKEILRIYIKLHNPSLSLKAMNCRFFRSIYIKLGMTYGAPQGIQTMGEEPVWYAEP